MKYVVKMREIFQQNCWGKRAMSPKLQRLHLSINKMDLSSV